MPVLLFEPEDHFASLVATKGCLEPDAKPAPPLAARAGRCPNSYGATALIEIRDEPAQHSLLLGALVFSPAAIRAA
jgi:hypothetical protein